MRHIFILILALIHFCVSQENAGTNVAPSLRICYNTTRYSTRDYRLPSTINVLIELIRKIEDGNPSQDSRELSFQLLHRFRQDGIRKLSNDLDSSKGLPYSPKGWEAFKNRLQLKKLTPGNAVNFNNDSISTMQACSLHYMISSTVEIHSRGDESQVCGRTARYQSRIRKRAVNEFNELELNEKSTCPIESGVIYTKWGAVKGGLILAGIAAGFEPMKISTDLDNTYASTIAGELAETALNQVSGRTVGNGGNWNSTIEPKYYFLTKNDRNYLYFTDAEIRGGLDGLFLSLNIDTWTSRASNIKISQILDLYYSRGVFNNSARACNRKSLTQNYIEKNKLVSETVSFSRILEPVSQLQYTPNEENLPGFINETVDIFNSYLASNLNDVTCSAENDLLERVSTDVLIFLDTSWDHNVVQPLLSYFLENIDINNYESSYTIFEGANCDVIVNKSRSILDYYENFNLTQQQKYPTGFDYAKVIQTAERIFKAKLNNETDLTGQSTVILMVPHNSPTQSQIGYVQTKRNDYKSILPDLRIIVAGSGDRSAYNGLVTTSSSDIFTVSDNTDETQLKETVKAIIDRFRKLPRSVVNPKCGSSFSDDSASNFETTQFVEPLGINYHKISPNYFYNGHTLKIRGQGYGKLTVCISKEDVNPKSNSSVGTTCRDILSDEYSIDISNYCMDETVTDCSPVYISVQGGESSNIRCTEKTCRFPDNIKYTISLENVECSSGSVKFFISLLLIFTILISFA